MMNEARCALYCMCGVVSACCADVEIPRGALAIVALALSVQQVLAGGAPTELWQIPLGVCRSTATILPGGEYRPRQKLTVWPAEKQAHHADPAQCQQRSASIIIASVFHEHPHPPRPRPRPRPHLRLRRRRRRYSPTLATSPVFPATPHSTLWRVSHLALPQRAPTLRPAR